MPLRRGFKSEAAALAREIRVELGWGTLDRLDPYQLAGHLDPNHNPLPPRCDLNSRPTLPARRSDRPTLVQHLGLPQMVQKHLDLGDVPGRANNGGKMMILMASPLAAVDCIDAAPCVARRGRPVFWVVWSRRHPPWGRSCAAPGGCWGRTRRRALDHRPGLHDLRDLRTCQGGRTPPQLYRQAGLHPLLAIAAGTGDVLLSRLREGRVNTARGAASLCILPSVGPGKPSSVAPWRDYEPSHDAYAGVDGRNSKQVQDRGAARIVHIDLLPDNMMQSIVFVEQIYSIGMLTVVFDTDNMLRGLVLNARYLANGEDDMVAIERMQHPMIDQAMVYHEMREELEGRIRGRWIAICGSELMGDYDTYREAAETVQEKGFDPLNCFIRQVGVQPPVILSYGQ